MPQKARRSVSTVQSAVFALLWLVLVCGGESARLLRHILELFDLMLD